MLWLMLEEHLQGIEIRKQICVGDDRSLWRTGGAGGVLEEGNAVRVVEGSTLECGGRDAGATRHRRRRFRKTRSVVAGLCARPGVPTASLRSCQSGVAAPLCRRTP